MHFIRQSRGSGRDWGIQRRFCKETGDPNKRRKRKEKNSRGGTQPYYRAVLPNVKSCPKTFRVDVVFSADFRLHNLIQRERKGWRKPYGEKSVPHENGV